MGMFYTILFFGGIAAIAMLSSHLAYRYNRLKSELENARAEHHRATHFLNLFCRSLATVTDVDQSTQLVAHYFSDVTGSESLAIFTLAEDPADNKQKLHGSAVSGVFPPFDFAPDIVMAKAKYLLDHLRHHYIDIGEGVIGRGAATRESVLIENAAEYPLPEELPSQVDTLMATPLEVDGRLIGVVCAVNCKDRQRRFQPEDLTFLENLSYLAALACNLVSIYSERGRQQRILHELKLGREIQQSLLPAVLPQWGDYKISAYSGPALEVGGDYYDAVPIDENRLMVTVADATGKGVPACMLMAMCRSFVRSMAEHYTDLESFLDHLSRRLFQDTDSAHFLTMAVVVIDKEKQVCEYGSAGHTALLIRFPDDTTRTISPQGPALGLLPEEMNVSFDTLRFCFRPGTDLLLYTDGITEAVDRENQEFGVQRLEQIWGDNRLPPEEMISMILNEVQNFAGDMAQEDDQTMTMISR